MVSVAATPVVAFRRVADVICSVSGRRLGSHSSCPSTFTKSPLPRLFEETSVAFESDQWLSINIGLRLT